MADAIYRGSARFLRQLSSLQRGSTGKGLGVITTVVADCRPDVTIVVVTVCKSDENGAVVAGSRLDVIVVVVNVCKFDENGAAVVNANGLVLVEELIALCSLERGLVDMKSPVDAPRLVKAVVLEDSRLEEVKVLRETEDNVRPGVFVLLSASVVLLVREIVDDDIVPEVFGEPC